MDRENRYLIADALHPLVCTDKVRDELLLYNIQAQDYPKVFEQFKLICDKGLDVASALQELSGGQKVILMAILAIYSPARRIHFINLNRYLDASKANALKTLIDGSDKEILVEEDS
ncbi:MAG: hypothetical protein PHO85_06635 [Candidatus Cloacimonetes bacterium]|jgi:hypothetical protein|nr:hypothetical protein [Candidatus Cloacimonadota bacterium]MDD2506694.1 hypothetical protein [Candidatus Cloacimonadota bacterium]MDD4148178.1 hypothetical protein [Candidatus Cloacimonadota bacterium]MDD4560285.1 hypothetical protein [Candidatus Cloacimonadota bacterium]